MSDVLQISRRREKEAPAAPPVVALPYEVELPTKFYSRLAVEETIRAFAEISSVECRVGDGILHVTFKQIDNEAGDVIAEFLNHVLYHSATSVEEANR